MLRFTPLLLLVAWGCDPAIDRDNPCDPGAPPADQQQAVLEGALVLPVGFALVFEITPRVQIGGTVADIDPPLPGVDGRVLYPFRAGPVLPAPRHEIVVEAPGFAVAPGSPTAVGWAPCAPVDHLTIELVAAPTIALAGSVVVTDDAGCAAGGCAPVAGAAVELVGTPYGAVTDEAGAFALSSVPGAVTLRVGHAEFAGHEEAVVIGEPGPVALDPIALDPRPARLIGRVSRRDPAGVSRPAEGATIRAERCVQVSPCEGPCAQADCEVREAAIAAQSGSGGAFALDGLRGGAWRVYVALDPYLTVEEALVLAPGATADLREITLDLPRGALEVTVEREGAAGGGATVIARRSAPIAGEAVRLAGVTLPPDDRVIFDGLPTGDYRLAVVAEGYRAAVVERVEVGPGAPAAAAVRLEARTWRIEAPPLVGASPEGPFEVAVTLSGDDDLTHYRLVQPASEEGWQRLDGAPVVVALDGPGEQVIAVRLANEQGTLDAHGPDDLPAVSPVLEAVTVVDARPPAVEVQTRSGWVGGSPLTLATVCLDDRPGPLSLHIESDRPADGDGGAWRGPWAPTVEVALVGEGERQISARCVDAAGNAGPAAAITVGLDPRPPVIEAVVVAGGRARTGDRRVSVAVDAVDDLSGFDDAALAVGLEPLDCATARYGPLGATVSVTLDGPDGDYAVHVCARDRVGHVAAGGSSPITLDTTAPAPPTIALADGASHVAGPASLALMFDDDDVAGVVLGGDLARGVPRGELTLDAVPSPIALSAGAGIKTITAVAIDDVGNRSAEGRASIIFDPDAPGSGRLIVADGQALVTELTVPVTLLAEDADVVSMALWEVAGGDGCGAGPACDDEVFGPYRVRSGFTLDGEPGERRICWRVCDAAGNGSPAVDGVAVQYRAARPQPVLSTLAPASVPALSSAGSIVLTGRGLAADTAAGFGDFVLPCTPCRPCVGDECRQGPCAIDEAAYDGCRVDDGGGCADGGACAASCAERCVVALDPALLRRPGTYLVRLSTPAPVEQGRNASDGYAFFDVVAPLPEVLDVWPRGVVQSVDADGVPASGEVTVRLRARGLTDNAQVRLGPNFGRIVDAPLAPEETPDGAGLYDVALPVDGLQPDDVDDARIEVINPSPGGGVAGHRFGLNPERTRCAEGVPCPVHLRSTRAPLPDGRALAHDYGLDGRDRVTGVAVSGPAAVSVLDGEGRLLGRGLAEAGVMPAALFAEPVVTRLEAPLEGRPVGRRVPSPWRAAGAFSEGRHTSRFDGRGVVAADLDADGRPEVVSAELGRGGVAIYRDADLSGELAAPSPTLLASPVVGRLPGVADMDGDGHLDVALATDAPASLVVWRGRGDGSFEAARDVMLGEEQPLALALGDVDGDARIDALWCTGRGAFVRRGRVDGLLEPRQIVGPPCEALALGDLDGDGRPDIIGLDPEALWVRSGDGDAVEYDRGPGAEAGLAVGDVDLDGALDVVVTSSPGDGSGEVSLLLGDGAGGLSPPSARAIPAGGGIGSTTAVRVADLDADGWPDLLVTRRRGTEIVHNDGGAAFARASGLSVAGEGFLFSGEGLAVLDMNGDGPLDVVYGERGRVGVRFADVRRAAGSVVTDTPANGDEAFARVADIDGDGAPEVVVARHGDLGGTLQVVGGLPLPMDDFELKDLALGDVVGGPEVDAVAVVQGRLLVLAGPIPMVPDQPLSAFERVQPQNPPTCAVIADVDGDGADDLLVGTTGTLQRMSTAGEPRAFGRAERVFSVPGPINALAVGHIDDDGDPDLVVIAEPESGVELGVHLGGEGADFGLRLPVETAGEPQRARLLHVDDDGILDLLVVTRSPDSGAAAAELLLGDGAGGFAALASVPLPGPWPATLVDLEGDGRRDLVVAGPTLTVRRGVGVAAFEDPVEVLALSTDGPAALSLEVADVGLDGVPDVIAATRERTTVWHPPSPLAVTHRLTAHAVTSIAPGDSPTIAVHQAPMWLDHVAVRVRIEGPAVDAVRLVLRAPGSAQPITLDLAAGDGGPVWQASYRPADLPDLAALAGRWHGPGEWRLRARNDGATPVEITDFTVIVNGRHTRAAP